jgi:hypothetical protein
MACAIDHLVVTARTLQTGTEYIEELLGVELDRGGEHERMGTHNRLLKLGAALYLEVIAINPSAPPPARPRWFDLDAVSGDDPPHLRTWVLRTDDIDASLPHTGVPLGAIERMTRGELSWRITIAADGSLPFQGVMPSLIQWDAQQHPASRLRDRGCSLVALEGRHVDAHRIRRALFALDVDGPVTIIGTSANERPRLTATIGTPAGPRTLS